MAIASGSLGKAVWAYLIGRNLDPRLLMLNAVMVVATQDGQESITVWDAKQLGPQPTAAQLEIALTGYTATVQTFDRANDLKDLKIRALARAVHVRLGRPDVATMDLATWQGILSSAYDTERDAIVAAVKV